ncbi:MAG: M48 family metallopeptidase [Pirellulaceae bacterium]|nr:M48 family metallopeptidase [Pirellulaceae bacterium]
MSFSLLHYWLLTLTLLALSSQAHAQRPANPFFDPAKFFDQPDKFFELFTGVDSDEVAAEIAKVKVSSREERRYGDQVADGYLKHLSRQGLKFETRGDDVEYLESLVRRLKPFMKRGGEYRKIRVVFVASERVDARSFPGGTLVFFRGMLKTAPSEAALVGVVGHELSHLDRGHQLVHVRRMKYITASFQSQNKAFDFKSLMRANGAMMQTFLKPFRPEDEAEADRDATNWLHRAGYDSAEFVELFRRFDRLKGGRAEATPGFLRSHPLNAERIQAVRMQAAQLNRTKPLDAPYVGVENLERRIPRDKKEFR